jgi:hypothetical protein
LWMSLLPCSLRNKDFTMTLCSIRSIQMFRTYLNASIRCRWKRSSAPDPIDKFSRWTHTIDLELDLVSRMLFGYWQFSLLRKVGGPGIFSPRHMMMDQFVAHDFPMRRPLRFPERNVNWNEKKRKQ